MADITIVKTYQRDHAAPLHDSEQDAMAEANGRVELISNLVSDDEDTDKFVLTSVWRPVVDIDSPATV